MTAEWENLRPDEREDFVGVICDGRRARAGSALERRLARDPALREALDADRELMASLRVALRAEPLAPAVERRIRDRAARELDRRRPAGWQSGAALTLAAAAALLLGVIWTAETPVEPARPALELTPEDSSAIVAAFEEVGWKSAVDYSVEYVALRVDALQQRANPTGDSGLSWDVNEAWDLPAESEPPGQTCVEMRRSIS